MKIDAIRLGVLDIRSNYELRLAINDWMNEVFLGFPDFLHISNLISSLKRIASRLQYDACV